MPKVLKFLSELVLLAAGPKRGIIVLAYYNRAYLKEIHVCASMKDSK